MGARYDATVKSLVEAAPQTGWLFAVMTFNRQFES